MATVHRDDITIGGERSVVELLIKLISKKNEIQKRVMGEDANLEKIGRILNRVTTWGRDGITIEAGQRHVTEMYKDLEVEEMPTDGWHYWESWRLNGNKRWGPYSESNRRPCHHRTWTTLLRTRTGHGLMPQEVDCD